MQIHPNEFFADHTTWPFIEHSSLDRLAIELKSRPGQERLLELSLPPAHRSRGFFDRMTVTPTSLALNRIRMNNQTLDIRPPLVITADDQPNHVPNLLPGIEGSLGPATKPYDGRVVFRNVTEIPRPGSPTPDVLWSVGIESRGQDKQIVFRALFQFLRSAGLIEYIGDVYGVFFVYRRTDLPEFFPPPPSPAPAPPVTPPLLPKPGPATPVRHDNGGEYHVRTAKEVFDAEVDAPLRKRLIDRARGERRLANLLVRHDLIEPNDPVVRVFRQQAKTDPELAENLRRHRLLD